MRGWTFLMNAIARFGKNGAYQKLTHYGNEFIHNDELAWAACEMYLATGDASCHQRLQVWMPDPNAPEIRRYGWWRLFASWGCAIRSYAFAERTGRLGAEQLDAGYLGKCQQEVLVAADDLGRRAASHAYGTSFPIESKRFNAAGWYFSNERAFDVTVAYQLEPRAEYLETILGNLNYEGGCNPINICFVEGLGWHRQRERVHQYAHNDRRVLPPSGFPLGNIQSGFAWFPTYGSELRALCFPPDGASSAAYPLYDRWADTWNVSTEFVGVDQARCLGTLAFLASLTELAGQPWSSAAARISVPAEVPVSAPVTLRLTASGLDLSKARVVWEIQAMEPSYAPANFPMLFSAARSYWIEAEACLPDGRRVVAETDITASFDVRTVAGALDITELVSTGEPPARWFAQTEETHDGVDAAETGNVPRGKRSRMDMTVRGPGTLRFWWKAYSTDRDDRLRFLVDGLVKRSLSGARNWQQVIYSLPPGEHTVRWEYQRDRRSASKQSRGWVDQVTFSSAVAVPR